MKKIISLLILASCPLFGDYHVSVGTGPFDLSPGVGVGFRDSFEGYDMDASVYYTYSQYVRTLNFSVSSLFKPWENGFYLGPSLGVNYFHVKGFGNFSDTACGVVLGKNFDNDFLEFSLQKEISSKLIHVKGPMVRIKWGWLF